MIMSIGSNIQYKEENRNFKYEVFILQDFQGKEFYGESLDVALSGFIRCEALFPNFSSFIEAMENDIRVGMKKLAEESLSKAKQF